MPSGDLSVKTFISDLAAPVFAPGGGAASAVCAALSSSLICMAASLTAKNPRYSVFREELSAAADKLQDLNTQLISLIDRDAEAFEPLSKVYKLPKDSEGYIQKKHEAVLNACNVPEEILLCISEISCVLADIPDKCSQSILPDICCAAYLSAAAAKCAAVTVFSNTNMIRGTVDAARIETETIKIRDDICSICERTASSITGMISPEAR